MSSCLVDYRFYSVKRDFLCFGMLINYRLIVYSFSTIRVVKKLWSLHTSPVAHQAGTYLRFLQYEVTRNNTIPWVGCQSTSGFHLAFHWPCSTMGGRERHCESKVSCPRTQRIVTGQGLNPNHSILVVASAITFRQSILLKLWLTVDNLRAVISHHRYDPRKTVHGILFFPVETIWRCSYLPELHKGKSRGRPLVQTRTKSFFFILSFVLPNFSRTLKEGVAKLWESRGRESRESRGRWIFTHIHAILADRSYSLWSLF